jgi:hypothetical protein
MGSNQGDTGIHGHSGSSNPCFRCPPSERWRDGPASVTSVPFPRSRLRTSRAPKSPSGASDLNPGKMWLISGAIEGTRTPTPLPVHGPEPCASANSATMASGLQMQRQLPAAGSVDLPSYSTSALPAVNVSSLRPSRSSSASFDDQGHPSTRGFPRGWRDFAGSAARSLRQILYFTLPAIFG